jgi:uncharacterized protein YfbU (UPF0304 family)
MDIKPAERLALIMLADIYEHLGIQADTGLDTKFLRNALHGGHDWALEWDMSGIVSVEPKPSTLAGEVADILQMYISVENSYAALSDAERATIEDWRVKFPGFDGNNEGAHMSVARFLIEDMGRFAEFKNRALNSHSHTLSRARAMLEVYQPLARTMGFKHHEMGLEHLTAIANAK